MKSVTRRMSGRRHGWSSGVSLEHRMRRVISRGSAFMGLCRVMVALWRDSAAVGLSFAVSQRLPQGLSMESPVDHASAC